VVSPARRRGGGSLKTGYFVSRFLGAVQRSIDLFAVEGGLVIFCRQHAQVLQVRIGDRPDFANGLGQHIQPRSARSSIAIGISTSLAAVKALIVSMPRLGGQSSST
jgi:hypothetical protein